MITKLLNVAEVAHILGVSKGTAYSLIRDMNYIQIGKKMLVSEQALETYIEEHSCQSQGNSKAIADHPKYCETEF